MLRFNLIALSVMMLALAATAADTTATSSAPAASGPTVTLIGSVFCDMHTIAKRWDHKATGPEHVLVIYAFGGTPQIKADVDSIMKEFWPGETLDADQAKKLMDEFTNRVKYYLTPSDMVNSHHREVDYPCYPMAITGTISQRDSKKWIDVTNIETKNVKIPYPAKMLAPDKPMIMPENKPLNLKITDKLSLKCIKIPAGKFLCGAPFYECPRWQDEFPHMFTLTKPYYMAETLITQEMFEAVMGVNPSKRVPGPSTKTGDTGWREQFRHRKPDEGPTFAVENCTWKEIQDFCKKVSELNGGMVVRVPTQGEWEWAARVGTSSPVFHEKYVEQRSYLADREGKCEPVKKHPPNAWGLYDMVKTGWEWVSDYKDDNIRYDVVDFTGPPRERAAVHGSGPLRRMEGGAYHDDTHLTLHGAIDENGNGEEGIAMFRLVVEVDKPAAPATAPADPGAKGR